MIAYRVLIRMSLVVLSSLSVVASAQTPPPAAYDVSSVKPHEPGDQSMSWRINDDGFSTVNVDLKNVIASAWGLRSDQIAGEPAWVGDVHWDITGKSTELRPQQLKALTPAQRDQMTQQLLAERFKLRAHLETRTGPVFTLVPAKGGVKLNPIPMTAEEKATGKVPGSGLSVSGGSAAVMEARKISLSMLMGNLSLNLHQTVIDKTGLPADAVYDFTLRWAPDLGPGTAADSDALPLPAALQDQLGLHLEASKGPVQVLVVDHVEKPSAN